MSALRDAVERLLGDLARGAVQGAIRGAVGEAASAVTPRTEAFVEDVARRMYERFRQRTGGKAWNDLPLSVRSQLVETGRDAVFAVAAAAAALKKGG